MSAPILKPGDAVHLMIPVRPQRLDHDAFEAALRARAESYVEIFKRYGVFVDSWTGSDTSNEMTVVAVFRKVEDK